jgi:hypothetical protein
MIAEGEPVRTSRAGGHSHACIKVLCGDQVYLDNPWLDTTARWYGGNYRRGLFREMLFKKYVDTWGQVTKEDAGFQQLLKDGANYFCSDDHEFWNNAPNFGGVGFINTLTQKQRDWWLGTARELFEAFQSPQPLMQFEVSPLSVCIADTRIDRDPERKGFMKNEDLRAVERWIEGLRGPGVLVVGQPVLAGGTSLRRSLLENLKETVWSWLDGNLSDYEQYEELVGYIKSSEHSIVLLSGDVHFGRIACVRSKPDTNDATLVEVISSPMQLVLERKMKRFGTYEEAPTDHFPINENHKAAEGNHFATVGFTSREDGKIDMQVRAWPILSPGGEVSPNVDPIFQATLS